MKTISTFELLVKRILPLGGGPNPNPNLGINTVARRVVQAHFLTISNLELDRPVYFSLSYYVSNFLNAGSAAQDLRELVYTNSGGTITRNFDIRYDGNGTDNINANIGVTQNNAIITAVPFRQFNILKTRNLLLAPGETGLVAFFPNITGQEQTASLVNILNPTVTPSPGFEVRGFVKIQQESSAEGETNPYINRPAQLLVSSEQKGTFLDNDFPLATELIINGGSRIGLDFDQLAYSLPLAEGKSLYTLDGA
jgi:hypothetical protein